MKRTQGELFDLPRTTRPPDGWAPCTPPELRGERVVCLDAETDGLAWWDGARPVGWSFYLPESGRGGYLPFGHEGGGNLDEAVVRRWFERELRGIKVENINTKFDLHIARAWGQDLEAQGCTFGDVAHRAALLDDHRFRFNLDQLAQDFLGEDEGKFDLGLRDKGNLWRLPAWEVEPYARVDTELIDKLVRRMDPMIAEQDLNRVLTLEEDVIPVVVEMEKNGMHVDVDALFGMRDAARDELKAILWDLYRESGVLMSSPDNRSDLAKLFARLHIENHARTAKGDVSFSADALKHIHHPAVDRLRYASQLQSLLSKYLEPYCRDVRQRDGWLRYNLHQLRIGKDEREKYGTVSGRFSSAGDDLGGFNIQQVVSADKQKCKPDRPEGWCPKYIVRNLFRPQQGVWLAIDASQIEYRIFAHYASDPDILAAYAEDVPEDIAYREKRGRWTDYHNKVQAILQRAKPEIGRKKTKITNFCKLFGAAIIKFALTLETITEAQARALEDKYPPSSKTRWQGLRHEPLLQEAWEVYDLYDEQFPSAKRMLDLAKTTAKERGYVTTILGRRARFPKKQRVHSALNRAVQGTAADINKRCIVEAYKRRHELGLTMRATVHDELDADLADASMLPRVEDVFNTQWIPLRVPILWEAGIGPSWGEAKGKA